MDEAALPAIDRAFVDSVLARIGVIPFDGPSIYRVMGERYVTLTSDGIKAEGADCGRFPTQEDAWREFIAQILEYSRGAEQMAFRRNPEMNGQQGRWYVSCRVARFPNG